MTNTTPINVTSIGSKQPAPPAKFTVAASLDGFPVQVEVEGKASDLRALVDRLKAIGAEPPQIAQAQAPVAQESAKKTAPVCPDHGTPMKASRKPGAFFCPRRTDDGDFCPHKA
jgi:hypothetical protein